MKGSSIALICAALIASPLALAQSRPDSPSLTEQWLSIQREGTEASAVLQKSTPVEQEKSAERWLKSFEHEIPEVSQDASVGGST